MTDEEKYLFDKQFTRFDFYINSINVKSAFIVAFNTFILGILVLKYNDIIMSFEHHVTQCIALIIFLFLFISIGVSLINVFLAVKPFLKSGSHIETSSLFFFNSLSKIKLDDYRSRVNTLTSDIIKEDIITQTHVLAQGAANKFRYMDRSIHWLIYFVIMPLLILYVLRIIDWAIMN